MSRKEFVMSDEQHARLMKACRPVPMIMLQCGPAPSAYDMAMIAWQELGAEMGFDWNTVEPVRGKDNKYFTAVEKEPSRGDQT
jgi:hypothetical protein